MNLVSMTNNGHHHFIEKNMTNDINTIQSTKEPYKKYVFGEIIGTGSFGKVFEIKDIDTNCRYALKKVLQDPRYKNRELDIMKTIDHCNIVKLMDYFYTNEINSEDDNKSNVNKYLNVIMEYVPDTLYKVSKYYVKMEKIIPIQLISVYVFQILKAVGFIHSLGICHRDIKPQNLLVDTSRNVLKLCDFGSAKKLMPNEPSVAYICSRFYRAPELMLGATEYTPNIDLWSIGCVLGELLLGKPIFSGDTSIDQLVKIIQVLGTPTKEQMIAMNKNSKEVSFPTLKPKSWLKYLPENTPLSAIDLMEKMLRYEPELRIKPYEAMGHPFFNVLRGTYENNKDSTYNFPSNLFEFNSYERSIIPKDLINKILPKNYCIN